MTRTIKHFLLGFIFCFCHLISLGQQNQKNSLFLSLKTAKEDTNKVKLLISYSKLYQQTSRDSSLLYLRKGLSLSKKLNYKWGMAHSYYIIGQVHEAFTRQLDSAQYYCFNSLNLAKVIHDSLLMGESYRSIGFAYLILNKNSKTTLAYYDSAITIFYNVKDTMSYIDVLSRKATLLKGFKIYQLSKNKKMPFALLVGIGNVYVGTGQIDSSLIFFNAVLDTCQKQKNTRWVSYMYATIAMAYNKQKKYDLAIKNAKTGLQIAEKNHLTKETLDNINALYEIYKTKKD
jgi:tetratricopeptide (TPR) repeat protein